MAVTAMAISSTALILLPKSEPLGGNDADTTCGTISYTLAQLGVDNLEDLADAEIGIRATSVGEDREGSLKLADTGEYQPPCEEPSDDFPEWSQNISNLTLIFNQTAGDTKPKSELDGYYTVKIDVPEELGDDPDAYIEDLLSALISHDPNLDSDADLMGIVIKGGLATTQYFAYGDYNSNGTAPDPLPEGIGFSLPGDKGNVEPINNIDTGYVLSLSGDDFLFA
ncbi:hypothetical protein CLG85_021930 [Yangia mangrovi]|uniref:Uncharacterized protein n=1 Tax=Alloyangia mangrovi TaxID=1779329 RepID=A0ABT2KPN6_9RHOB|nr:hypothetical protein [Alloyangia mangrovi]MCT4372819.1 hypothetical protein [Alloyangia mangrovi]